MNSDLLLFLFALAKASLLTGIGPGIVLAVLAECCGFRVVEIGIEKVQHQVRGGQLARLNDRELIPAESWATSPPRKVRTA